MWRHVAPIGRKFMPIDPGRTDPVAHFAASKAGMAVGGQIGVILVGAQTGQFGVIAQICGLIPANPVRDTGAPMLFWGEMHQRLVLGTRLFPFAINTDLAMPPQRPARHTCRTQTGRAALPGEHAPAWAHQALAFAPARPVAGHLGPRGKATPQERLAHLAFRPRPRQRYGHAVTHFITRPQTLAAPSRHSVVPFCVMIPNLADHCLCSKGRMVAIPLTRLTNCAAAFPSVAWYSCSIPSPPPMATAKARPSRC